MVEEERRRGARSAQLLPLGGVARRVDQREPFSVPVEALMAGTFSPPVPAGVMDLQCQVLKCVD